MRKYVLASAAVLVSSSVFPADLSTKETSQTQSEVRTNTIPVCDSGPYIVFFDWNEVKIMREAAANLDRAVMAYRKCSHALAAVPVWRSGLSASTLVARLHLAQGEWKPRFNSN